ncbi:DUF1440 domain-containing protein [Sphingomonas sp.]|uniref:DUF1440 domain-containing protein n=1 Tax=Sphingomonas sp. TaxID=28214 RepID=UPI0035BBBAEF
MVHETAIPDLVKGAVVGLAAGLIASLAMNQFQAVVQTLSPPDDDADEPATEKAADRVAVAATGEPVAKSSKPAAGNAVHYAFGALLGVAYGVAAEYRPRITMGYGTVFGTGVAAVMDEGAVPAAGLAPAPWQTPAGAHAYALVSHLIFGAVTEVSRRLLRSAI